VPASSAARPAASTTDGPAVVIRTAGCDAPRNRAPAATHHPCDRSPLSTADASRTGTRALSPLTPGWLAIGVPSPAPC
jgi:hypothetical protein